MAQKIIELQPSDFSETFLYLNGRRFSLNDYPYLRAVYNCDAERVVLKFSRQTAKSTTLSNIMVTQSIMHPHFKTLYISPSVDQTKVFSHDRVAPILEQSAFVKKHYLNSALIQNVFMKQLLNGSRMYLRYAHLNADRVRGYSADMCLFDEVQDQMEDNIPVIEETMSRSLYKRSWFSGTPKLSLGPLEERWESSTKYEWMPKCSHCNKWNILDEDSIGLTQLICKYCERSLEASTGQWVSTGDPSASYHGFRVCLLHFHRAPWVSWERDIILKQQTVSKAIFYNETLAKPYDLGAAPISREELYRCCSDRDWVENPSRHDLSGDIFMGIDYGPVNSDKSFTNISIVRRRSGQFEVLYGKRYVGKEAEYSFIHSDVVRLMKKWNCTNLCSDYGMGEASNSVLRKILGPQRVISFQHLPNQKELVKWNSKLPAYTLNRTQIMANMFEKFKGKEIIFPKLNDKLEILLQDILNIQMDYKLETNTLRYINKGPDDFLHATLFAVLGAELYHGLNTFQSL